MAKYNIVIYLENGDSSTEVEIEATSSKDAIETIYKDDDATFVNLKLDDMRTIFIPKEK